MNSKTLSIPPKRYDRDYYFKRCEGFEDFAKGRMSTRLDLAFSFANINPGEKVLDIGCGRGEASMECFKRGCRVWGIDYSQDAISIAKDYQGVRLGGKTKSISFIRMNAMKLKFPDEFFDCVLLFDVVEHLYPLELEKVLAEAKRVTKIGGRIIIHTPNAWYNKILYFVFGPFGFKEADDHINVLSNFQLRNYIHKLRCEDKIFLCKKRDFYYDMIKRHNVPEIFKILSKKCDIIFNSKITQLIISNFPLNQFLFPDMCAVIYNSDILFQKRNPALLVRGECRK